MCDLFADTKSFSAKTMQAINKECLYKVQLTSHVIIRDTFQIRNFPGGQRTKELRMEKGHGELRGEPGGAGEAQARGAGEHAGHQRRAAQVQGPQRQAEGLRQGVQAERGQ